MPTPPTRQGHAPQLLAPPHWAERRPSGRSRRASLPAFRRPPPGPHRRRQSPAQGASPLPRAPNLPVPDRAAGAHLPHGVSALPPAPSPSRCRPPLKRAHPAQMPGQPARHDRFAAPVHCPPARAAASPLRGSCPAPEPATPRVSPTQRPAPEAAPTPTLPPAAWLARFRPTEPHDLSAPPLRPSPRPQSLRAPGSKMPQPERSHSRCPPSTQPLLRAAPNPPALSRRSAEAHPDHPPPPHAPPAGSVRGWRQAHPAPGAGQASPGQAPRIPPQLRPVPQRTPSDSA